MSYQTSIHGQWSSRMVFILAATGATVGLGNIWKFPYLAGEYGGGAFVLVYLLCIAFIGFPLMVAEVAVGRRGRLSPINTLRSLSEIEGGSPRWVWAGGLGVLAGLLIGSFYSVIAGWALAYMFRAASGAFEHVTAQGIASIFNNLITDPERLLAWHTIFMVMTVAVLARGIRSGLERAVKLLVPGLLVMLLVLIGYGASTGYLGQTLFFLFRPDFSSLSFAAVLEALGHAFFTLSLGMGAIMIYGSYLPRQVPIMRTSLLVVLLDTLVALLAGLAIFSIAFAHELPVNSGPGLIFQTLPMAFGKMQAGGVFGGIFFLLLVFAAWTSAIALLEPAVAWLVESLNLQRVRAAVLTGFVAWLLGIVSLLSFSQWAFSFEFAGMQKQHGLFDLFSILASGVLLPLGGLSVVLFTAWVMHRESVLDALGGADGPGFRLWYFLVRYVAPVALVVVFLWVLGVM
ncbi:MAG: sodium-dependent transporter [Candidatus Sedimenticola endophacoides]|uniref:Transporter n=1 Tax=Candidatus Sedimenticola endophacoides TaxID=2548426 RepID=A0A6N4DGF5_9GAMM|nr:MAG: sodium-dependent transporter [Candidatus Sedimenticola endophacoides]PUE02451.1 MAG: sodium-dependent transporter [Candidatus Sedimenticola endophacoides]PUE05260.1 MAG: sodium-dependent transporter [Candidatus Sedimenticola endophacoides]